MKIIQETHPLSPVDSNILSRYLGGMNYGVFDVETLGLNPQYCPLVLAGFLTPLDATSCQVTQYFAESPDDEPAILENVCRDLASVDYLITYNGRHFDVPFIERRCAKLGLPAFDFRGYDLDLYLMLNGYSQLKYFVKNLKQKTIERYMGLGGSREDSISGAESIELYEAFLSCYDADEKALLQRRILLHNHDDVLQLFSLMPILKQVDVHKAFYYLGFPVGGRSGWPTLSVSSIRTGSWGVDVEGVYAGEPFSYISYDSFSAQFSCEFREDGSFSFKFHTERHKGNVFLNLRLYFDDFASFASYPHFVNNFLLVSNGREANYLEINAFIRAFLHRFMEDMVCPLMVL